MTGPVNMLSYYMAQEALPLWILPVMTTLSLLRCLYQGFKQHQLHDVLVQPGTADLTADVDFAAFKRAALEEGQANS